MSFWDYLAAIFTNVAWLGVLWFGSILLATVALFAGVAAAIIGGQRIADKHHWAWNFIYVPAVLAIAAFVILFASWLGIEVAS